MDEHVPLFVLEVTASCDQSLDKLKQGLLECHDGQDWCIKSRELKARLSQKYLSGVGIAHQRKAIVDGLRDSVIGFSVNVPGTIVKDVINMVLVARYFDTMKEIGVASKSSAVFIPHGPGAVRDVVAQICDELLQGSSTQY